MGEKLKKLNIQMVSESGVRFWMKYGNILSWYGIHGGVSRVLWAWVYHFLLAVDV